MRKMPKNNNESIQEKVKEHGPNYYEYAIDYRAGKGLRFFRPMYKIGVILIIFLLDLVFGFFISEKFGTVYISFIFISPLLMLFIILGILYFTNGFLFTSFEYEIEKGVFKIIKFNGKHVFGHIYKKTLLEKRISEIDYIGKTKQKSDLFFDCTSNNGRDSLFCLFVDNEKNSILEIETTPKLESILKFYSGNRFPEE